MILGLITDPDDADDDEHLFNFGQIFEFEHDQCEALCEAEPKCAAYTQFASYYPVNEFFASCIGRSSHYDVNEDDSATLSGINPGTFRYLKECSDDSDYCCLL